MNSSVRKKKTRILKLLLAVFISAFIILFPGVCLAQKVTVDLVWKFKDPCWLEAEVVQGVYALKYDNVQLKLQPAEKILFGSSTTTQFLIINQRLIMPDKPSVQLIPTRAASAATATSGVFRIREPGKDWLSYRGSLTVTGQAPYWRLQNTLDQESYLNGVVPIEMSNAWAAKGSEALKAQAVAARTYLLKNMDEKGTITDSPNIHQAYLGKTVEGAATLAVRETAGEILVDDLSGQLLSVYYSSNNGGYSEVPEHVWKNPDKHYTSEPDPFSVGVGGFTDKWRFMIAADVLGQSFGLAPVREIQLKKYSSGRVYQVKLLDWLGKEKVLTGGEFVQKFYPYNRELSGDSFLGKLFKAGLVMPEETNTVAGGRNFDMSGLLAKPESRVPKAGPRLAYLKSSYDSLSEAPGKFGVFIFDGRGWGHGVGMSQWGAYNMAAQGYSYKQILDHYYKNSNLAKSP